MKKTVLFFLGTLLFSSISLSQEVANVDSTEEAAEVFLNEKCGTAGNFIEEDEIDSDYDYATYTVTFSNGWASVTVSGDSRRDYYLQEPGKRDYYVNEYECFSKIPAPSLDDKILEALEIIETGDYAVEKKLASANLVYLKDWPQTVINGLKENFKTEEGYYISAPAVESASYASADGEYQLNYSILRSLEIVNGSDSAYIAIYNTYGGEWGRDECFLSYFVIGSNGTNIINGRVDSTDYCQDDEF